MKQIVSNGVSKDSPIWLNALSLLKHKYGQNQKQPEYFDRYIF